MPGEDESGQALVPNKTEKGEVDDLERRLLAISGTSFAFAGLIMAWFNSYLSKSIPHMDNVPAASNENVKITSSLKSTDSPPPSYPNSASPINIPISYNTLELVFIALASSAVGVLLGVTLVAYQISLKIRRVKSSESQHNLTERFSRLLGFIELMLGMGVTLGFLSISFSILLFHKSPLYPFLCFLTPLSACAIATVVILFVV